MSLPLQKGRFPVFGEGGISSPESPHVASFPNGREASAVDSAASSLVVMTTGMHDAGCQFGYFSATFIRNYMIMSTCWYRNCKRNIFRKYECFEEFVHGTSFYFVPVVPEMRLRAFNKMFTWVYVFLLLCVITLYVACMMRFM